MGPGAFDLTIADHLPRVACPAYVVAGRHDHVRPPAYVEELAGHISGACDTTVDSGHFMNVQSPDLVADLIESLLDDLGFG